MTTTPTGAAPRHRKPDTDNTLEGATRWWVIAYGPTDAPFYLADRPRIVAASFAAVEIADDHTPMVTFFLEDDSSTPARPVRRITAECSSIVGYDTWDQAVAAAYPHGGPEPEEEWSCDLPPEDVDAPTGEAHVADHGTDDEPLVDVWDDPNWNARILADLAALDALLGWATPDGASTDRTGAAGPVTAADAFVSDTGDELPDGVLRFPGTPRADGARPSA